MFRLTFRATALTVLLCAWSADAAHAQRFSGAAEPARFPGSGRVSRPMPTPTGHFRSRPFNASNANRIHSSPVKHAYRRTGQAVQTSSLATNTQAAGTPVMQGYPYLNAPLYPASQQRVPYQIGGAVITNQAFSPHEMLHPHKYRAMYPPYYYRVKGHWWVSPWGVWSSDNWELQGTEVKIEYRDKIGLLSLFKPPKIR